ncbi:tumor necrosis factor receptor superfamily member 19L isoform X2 [Hippocampus comes]|uniref:RELT TNF receptor n=1 Tax=Hippocampus comes TaxID=109280 RepID=A0A3Q2Y4N9_HIPCM|nr:PREDICTED: tumor necrosis factor receptor superfamily member 19L isoform X2 [Hippocampus comes]XP_019741394.1 PREDICTED: tumor necrosis factor receptor superfamily member 19L isoform X2 [Hippocampus comes]
MRNPLCSAIVLLTVFGCHGTLAVHCQWAEGCVCLKCSAGQEPSKPCGKIHSRVEEVRCRSCQTGTFSDSFDSELCRPHSSCKLRGQKLVTPGTAISDAVCGDCLPGFNSKPSVGKNASKNTPCVEMTVHIRRVRTVGQGLSSGAGGPVNDTVVRSAENTAEYAVFALVPIFCVTGLLGIMICNLLKKKGCRCNAEKDGLDAEAATPNREGNNYDDLNEDTIGILVRLITEKKENAAALEELLQEYESKQMALSKVSSVKFPMLPLLSSFCSLPRLCPHQSHLHTISGLSDLGPKHGYRCSRCAQKKWPAVLIPPLDSFKDPLRPPQTYILPTLKISTEQKKDPLLSGMCVNTQCPQPALPKNVQETVESNEKQEWTELKVLSVGRFQVAQIPEYKPVIEETKGPSQDQRKSIFGGIQFSSPSLAGFMR